MCIICQTVRKQKCGCMGGRVSIQDMYLILSYLDKVPFQKKERRLDLGLQNYFPSVFNNYQFITSVAHVLSVARWIGEKVHFIYGMHYA